MLPVSRPYLDDGELLGVAEVFNSRWLGQGATVTQFEKAVADYLGARHVVATNTGTSALHLALEVLGVGPGDEAIVPSLTFCASVQAILACGATPVFCEARQEDLNMDVDDVARRITSRTKVIMPVHYCGIPCDMDALLDLATATGTWIVEDAAHAFGSSYKGRMLGSFGHITCFSFDPIKNITCGEGGALITQSEETAQLAERMRMLGIDRDGWCRHRDRHRGSYDVTTRGFRYHLSNINAAVGLVQLEKAEDFRRKKCEIVRSYNQAFAKNDGLALMPWDLDQVFPFAYILRVTNGDREALREQLAQRGVGSGVHYPPNHLQSLFAQDAPSLPRTEALYRQILTLPLYYEMTDADVALVIDGVNAWAGKTADTLEQAGVL